MMARYINSCYDLAEQGERERRARSLMNASMAERIRSVAGRTGNIYPFRFDSLTPAREWCDYRRMRRDKIILEKAREIAFCPTTDWRRWASYQGLRGQVFREALLILEVGT